MNRENRYLLYWALLLVTVGVFVLEGRAQNIVGGTVVVVNKSKAKPAALYYKEIYWSTELGEYEGPLTPIPAGPGQEAAAQWVWDFNWAENSMINVKFFRAMHGTKVGQSYIYYNGGQIDYQPFGSLRFDLAPYPTTRIEIEPTDIPLEDGRKTIWAGEDTSLTAELFREGVDKIIAQTSNAANQSAAAVAGSNVYGEQVAQAQIQANQLVNFEGLTQFASLSAMESGGADAGAALAALLPVADTGTAFTLPTPSYTDFLKVKMPESFGGAEFDLNPFRADRLGGVCGWFRGAVGWLALVLLAIWEWGQVGTWMRGFTRVPQARGNAVVGGTGAQATAMVAAALITVAVSVAVTALVGFAFDGINPIGLLATARTSPLATMASGVHWMLDQLLPVGTLISCLLSRLFFNVYAPSVYAVASGAIRFVVP